MDWYQYYLRRMTTSKDKKVGVSSCKDIALRMFDAGPLPLAIESGACLLAALHEVDSDGADVMPIFEEIEQALSAELQGLRLDLETEHQLKILTTGCGRPRHRKRQEKKGGGN